ncbi:MAG: hypothetical protein ACOZNI_28930 [Myxococcota bacterium]
MLLVLACVGPSSSDAPDPDDAADSADTAQPDSGDGGFPVDREWASIAGAPADGLGNAVTSAGDPDADGDADVLVSAYLGNRVCVVSAPVPAGPNALDALETSCFTGESDADYAGYGIAGVGDADADGVDDLMVGSIGNGDGGADAGKAYLVSGPVAPGTFALADATATWRGENAGDYAGVALAPASDLTADGIPDVLVGASGYDAAGTAGGRAYLLPGPLVAGQWMLADAYASFTGLGVVAEAVPPPHGAFGVGDFVGDAMLSPGDLDGDGFDDLVLGASGDATLGPSTGRVAIFRGPLGSGDHPVDAADAVYAGVAAGSYTGSPLAGPGDLTGDGRADLLVAADGAGPGYVHLLAGSSQDGALSVAMAWARFDGEADGDLFGFALSAGDADGDGSVDLLVGSPASSRAGDLSGAAWLFRGPFASAGYGPDDGEPMHGQLGAGTFGSAVQIGPDLDLDGSADLAVGEYTGDAGGGFSGALYIINPLNLEHP